MNSNFNLRIGTSCLRDTHPRFNATKVLDQSYFGLCCCGTSDSLDRNETEPIILKDRIRQGLVAAYEWAIRSNLDIWIMPELCLDESDLNFLWNRLQTNSGNLLLVVPGSRYVDGKNAAPIWIKANDGKLHKFGNYCKRFPFQMNAKIDSHDLDVRYISKQACNSDRTLLAEDIVTNKDVSLITLYDGTVLGVAICRDVMDVMDKNNPLHDYCGKVDIMLVLSMNSGLSNLFTGGAESMARWHNCTTVYVNCYNTTPSAQDTSQEMSFALCPDRTKVAGIKGRVYYKAVSTAGVGAAYENLVSVIFSNSVKALPLPSDDNVLYVFNGGKLVV